MIIYKFLGRKGAKKTLESGKVLLRTPIEFNDPFDCYYYVNDQEKQKAISLAVNYILFKFLYQNIVAGGKQLILGKANTFVLKQNLIFLDQKIRSKKQYKFDKQIELYHWIYKKNNG